MEEEMKLYPNEEHIFSEPEEEQEAFQFQPDKVEDSSDEEEQEVLIENKKEKKLVMPKVLGYDEISAYNKLMSQTFLSKNTIGSVTYISTEGITVMSLDEIDKNLAKTIGICSFCQRIFNNDMLIPAEQGIERQCYHCLFTMNYPIKNRVHVDGTLGLSIADYILKCKDVHVLDMCTRKSDNGGCFLCEYNLGIPITDIKELEKLYNGNNEYCFDQNGDDEVDELIAGMKMKRNEEVITVEI